MFNDIVLQIKNISTGKSDIQKFGYTIGTILLIVAVFLVFKGKGSFQYLIIISSFFFCDVAGNLWFFSKPIFLINF